MDQDGCIDGSTMNHGNVLRFVKRWKVNRDLNRDCDLGCRCFMTMLGKFPILIYRYIEYVYFLSRNLSFMDW